jgi:hypothetical protein
LVVVGLLFLAVAAGVVFYLSPATTDDPAPINQPIAADTDSPGIRTGTLDEALQIARDGLARMNRELIDYRGTITKRERVNGVLGPENQMSFKIRAKRPDLDQSMAVYLKFEKPDSAAGREVIWVADQNDGKLVVHESGMLSLVPVPLLNPKGFLAMQGNRYPITEIGFQNLVDQLLERGRWIEQEGGSDVAFVESYLVGDRECLLIQVRPRIIAGAQTMGTVQETKIDFSLAEIAIDKARQIPLRYAAYGIPDNPDDSPPLLEEYTYTNVETNVGLEDIDFDPANKSYQYP